MRNYSPAQDKVVSAKEIFVVGNSRSGTTMMSRILGRHSCIFSFQELHFFEQLWSPESPQELMLGQACQLLVQLISIQRNGYLTHKKNRYYHDEALNILSPNYIPLSPPEVYRIFLGYETNREGGTIPCEQTPRNIYYLQEILNLFPNAHIINMIRDPRDVMLSQKNKWRRRLLGGHNFPTIALLRFWCNYHPITMSMLWKSGLLAADRINKHPRVTHLRFEDLLESPERCLYDLCNRIRLEYNPEMLQVPQVGSSLDIDQPNRKGINPSAMGRWKHGGLNKSEIYICQRILEEDILKHGYQTKKIQPDIFSLAYYVLIFPFKFALAFLFNTRRSRSLIDTIRRRFTRYQ